MFTAQKSSKLAGQKSFIDCRGIYSAMAIDESGSKIVLLECTCINSIAISSYGFWYCLLNRSAIDCHAIL